MANWYCSSAAYTAVTQFAISHLYSIGDFVRALAAPTLNNEHVFRCTTGGTSAGSEPTWTMTNNGTTTSGGAVFTCVTGQSTYGWSAAAGKIQCLNGSGTGASRLTAGDQVFVSSDHSETQTASLTLVTNNSASPISMISVNRAGSVPPVAADVLAGATYATSSTIAIFLDGSHHWSGFTFSSGAGIFLGNNSTRSVWLKNCALVLNNATSASKIQSNTQNAAWTWQNVTVKFGHSGQGISPNVGSNSLDWSGTASAIDVAGTLPAALFPIASANGGNVSVRGVDLSGLGANTLVSATGTSTPGSRLSFANCKLHASTTIFSETSNTGSGLTVELINCDSGNTNYRCERHCNPQGDVTTETTITLSGGASDGTTTFSRKMVSTANAQALTVPLEGFPMDVWNTTTGSSVTATVEIISSGTLTTADISLQVEYLGDASSCLSSLADNYLATDLTAAGNVTSSSVTWNSSPATPVKQKLQVTFTPQKVGVVRGIVSLRKASATVYVNPVMAIA